MHDEFTNVTCMHNRFAKPNFIGGEKGHACMTSLLTYGMHARQICKARCECIFDWQIADDACMADLLYLIVIALLIWQLVEMPA
jgi:hypothetical protein